ncbi:hypothetical protein C7212DRAFT_99534, partial [Tuber magnatum]
KPKYHLLCHAKLWIQRYGILSNSHVETEESINAEIRSSLEHTNQQAPSKDLAYRYASAEGLRFVAQGRV